MEPLFFKAENGSFLRQLVRSLTASMEPLFFKAENTIDVPGFEAVYTLLQWSRFFSKRKMYTPTGAFGQCSSFNGAAFFQSGKCGRILLEPKDAVRASMEPLFFKAENPKNLHRSQVVQVASMEPLFFKAENVAGAGAAACGGSASMEPLFFKAENPSAATWLAADWNASMEPLFFKAENHQSQSEPPSLGQASMEPLFFKAENSFASSIRRKDSATSPQLQWSRFFSKRKILLLEARRTALGLASMEPLFFKAENG